MKDSLKLILTAITTFGAVMTAGMIHTRDKTLRSNEKFNEQQIDIQRERLRLDWDALEVEKSKQQLQSKFDRPDTAPPEDAPTPVSDYLKSLDLRAKLNDPATPTTTGAEKASNRLFDLENIERSSVLPFNVDDITVYIPTETFQLGGLAVCCFSTALVICVILLFLNNYQRQLLNKTPVFTSKYLDKLLQLYGKYLDISNTLIIGYMLMLAMLNIFVGGYLYVIYS